MKERQLKSFDNVGISDLSTFKDGDGQVIGRSLLLESPQGFFTLHVGTPAYISLIRQENLKIKDPEMKMHDNILPMPSVETTVIVANRLSQTPPENIDEFLENF